MDKKTLWRIIFSFFYSFSLWLGIMGPSPSQAGQRDFDYQLVLDLGSGMSAKGLTEKAESKGLISEIIDLKGRDPQEQYPKLKKLTSRSRLYIIGHCLPGVGHITSDLDTSNFNEYQFTYKDFADMLEKNAPQLIDAEAKAEGKILISLVACYAGSQGDYDEDSFAEMLSKELDNRKIRAIIHARTGAVSRHSGGQYRKLVNGRHKKDGSKVIVETINGKTTSTPFIYDSLLLEANVKQDTKEEIGNCQKGNQNPLLEIFTTGDDQKLSNLIASKLMMKKKNKIKKKK